jgi:hypothetical protein
MCLDTITERIDQPSALIESGWKTFNMPSGKLQFAVQIHAGSMAVPLDKWIKAEGGKIKVGSFKSYEPGFHVYEHERELRGMAARRVYYRGLHTRGIQDGKTVVVAGELFVPSQPDAWPPLGD